jgi:hypothetical protein
MRALLGATWVAAAGLFCPSHAGARPSGIVTGDCTGCHGASAAAVVEISTSPATFLPGDEVTFSVSVRAEQGDAASAGVFIGWPSRGELYTLPGAGLTLVTDTGLVHSEPMAAVAGVATFRFGYRAPVEPGGVTLDVAVLASNGDGRLAGDAPGRARYLSAFGCSGVTHYADLDRDGYGSNAFDTSVGCEGVTPPDGFAVADGDCNENSAATHPNALELCNRKDDDCDGEVDEDSAPVELFPDPDGDGYYGHDAGDPVLGCVGMSGYAAEGGDCLPQRADVSPGSTEICNGLDDDCDGQADERVLPQCGVGWCRRESDSCDAADCTPGTPEPERCNYRDDDCNGYIDDGTPCPEGSACLDGKCVELEGGTGGTGGSAGSTGGAGVAGTTDASGGSGSDTSSGGVTGGAPSVGGSTAGTSAEPSTATPTGCSFRRQRSQSSRAAGVFGLLVFALIARRAAARSAATQLSASRSARRMR